MLYEGMTGLTDSSVLNLKNKSFAITSELVIPAGGANGVVMSQGGAHAGWSVYLLDGIPHYTHNFVGLRLYTVTGERAVPEGTHQLRVEFDYDGGGISKGGTPPSSSTAKRPAKVELNTRSASSSHPTRP